MYSRYPLLLKAGMGRHTLYNSQFRLVAQQEACGNVLVLAPSEPVAIKRAEKDKGKLAALYERGYADAKKNQEQIMRFLGKPQTIGEF